MSASAEVLFEKIRQLDESIESTVAAGGDVTNLRRQRRELGEQLERAQSMLTEGRGQTLLRG